MKVLLLVDILLQVPLQRTLSLPEVGGRGRVFWKDAGKGREVHMRY